MYHRGRFNSCIDVQFKLIFRSLCAVSLSLRVTLTSEILQSTNKGAIDFKSYRINSGHRSEFFISIGAIREDNSIFSVMRGSYRNAFVCENGSLDGSLTT